MTDVVLFTKDELDLIMDLYGWSNNDIRRGLCLGDPADCRPWQTLELRKIVNVTRYPKGNARPCTVHFTPNGMQIVNELFGETVSV